ncbi:MAG: hypothetical protein H6505_03230 [Calditrichaeota bacterium]|nr:hypothetical protein [Calditrichota bacterium]
MILQTRSHPVSLLQSPESAGALDQIRHLPNPPLVPLSPEDILVRRCRLAGDAVDGHFGCFRTSDLEHVLALTNGAPALIGHNRYSIAVARFFGGTIETHQNHRYIVPNFYWPKAHSGAEDFRVLLDSGIITEASIAFTFEKPTCSVCGHDIRDCEHEPGVMYGQQLCHYWYDGVDKVLEGSFVYRGSQPGTGILSEMKSARRTVKHKRMTIRLGGKVYEVLGA